LAEVGAHRARVAPHGRPALLELQGQIAEAQVLDQLAAVTVVVAQSAIGLSTRRRLAAEAPVAAGGGIGVRNVRFVTVADLARELGESALAAKGRVPLTEAALVGVLRQTLSERSSGVFTEVGEHPATLRAFARTYRELRSVSAATLERAASLNPRSAGVIDACRRAHERLGSTYDDQDLLVGAIASLHADPGVAARQFGAVVCYLLGSIEPMETRLLRAIAEAIPMTMIIGATGDADIDDETIRTARSIADFPITELPITEPPVVLPVASEILSAPSADAEVLVGLRSILEWQQEGIPLGAIAIGFAGSDPYPRLVHEMLASAEIPFNGANVRRLSATAVGRVLLGGFELMDRDWRRDEVVGWLSTAPIRFDGREVPATEWDRVSRQAGIVSGKDAWRERLEQLLSANRELLADFDSRGDDYAVSDARRTRRLMETTSSFLAFMNSLTDRFARVPATWREWARWAQRFLDDTLGTVHVQRTWPTDESEAYTACAQIIGQLGDLDSLDPHPSIHAFRAALIAALDVPAPQTSRFGDGVFVGRVGQLAGHQFDAVLLLGMNDGVFPPSVGDDPLLGDEERASAGDDLVLRKERARADRRDFLAVLHGAQRTVMSFARGDQGNGRVLRPSRWLLDSLGVLAARGNAPSRTLYSSDVEGLGPLPHFRVVESYFAALGAAGEALSGPDWDLRELLSWHQEHRRLAQHPLVSIDIDLACGLLAQRERRSPRFSRFDGHLEGLAIPSPRGGFPLSASGLESYATCPRRYLFSRLFGVDREAPPEDVVRMAPNERGELFHKILERFYEQELARLPEDRISPDQPWQLSDRARLFALADDVFVGFERAGKLGRRVLWLLDRRAILRDLDLFLGQDSEYRRAKRAVPAAAELLFGQEGEAPVQFQLPDGGWIGFRGKVDRVDRLGDDSLMVIDYKSGSNRGFQDLETDPVARGTKLQLPIYSIAARQRFDGRSANAMYWFVTDRGDFKQIEVELGQETEERFASTVQVIVDGIEGGQFPGRPGEERHGYGFENCSYCAFDSICGSDRSRAWERKRGAPTLAAYRALSEGDGSEGDRSEGDEHQ
jgi:ATP-dependent helicase/nuclease subunit B